MDYMTHPYVSFVGVLWCCLPSVASCNWRVSDFPAASYQLEAVPLYFLLIQLIKLNIFRHIVVYFILYFLI